jgi:energy-converting hydrogenase Eha subunit A
MVAWLSMPTAAEVLLAFLPLIRCMPRRIPTSSTSCTVCSLSDPRWKCSVFSRLPLRISIVVAPTLPSRADPSKNTWSSSLAFPACSIEASLSSAILIVIGDLPILDGSLTAVGIFSVRLASGLNHLASWCRGPLCLLVLCVQQLLIILWSRCSLGSDASLVNAR